MQYLCMCNLMYLGKTIQINLHLVPLTFIENASWCQSGGMNSNRLRVSDYATR